MKKNQMIVRGCWGLLCVVVLALVSRVADAQGTEWDIYLLGGQSNAVGWNTNLNDLPASLQVPQTDVMFFNGVGGSWGDLEPGSGNNNNAFGPEVTFGRTMADDNPSRNIAIVKYAVGGTDLNTEWNPDDTGINQYDNFLTTVNNAINALPAGDTYSIKGMIWMQGEKDTASAATAAAYNANLVNLIASVRSDVSAPDMSFAIGQLAFSGTSRIAWPVVQSGQARTAAFDDGAFLVITTDLPLQGDNVHLASAAQEEFGQRLAEAIQGQVDQLQITNASFETPFLVDGAVSSAVVVSGWVKSDTTPVTANPDAASYSDSSVLDVNGGTLGDMDGTNVLVLTGDSSVEQTLSAPVEAGATYTLTAAVGGRDAAGSAGFAGARIELLADGQVLADSGGILIAPIDGTFTDVSFEYTAQAGDVGALGIRLVSLNGGAGSVVDFDNLRITSTGGSTGGAIAVANHDFESNGQADDAFSTGAIDFWQEVGTGGVLNPSTARWYSDTGTDDTSATGGAVGTMIGPNVGFGINGSTLSQVLTTSVVVGDEYLLEVSIGDRDIGANGGRFSGYALELWDGDSLLATTGDVSASPGGEGVFADATLSYTAQAGDAGLLEIRLVTLGGGGGTDFDNVRLTNVTTVACLLGDVDLSGTVDFADIAPFIAILSGGGFQCEADCDESGAVDFADIGPFIAILSGGP